MDNNHNGGMVKEATTTEGGVVGEDSRVLLAVQNLLNSKGPGVMDPHGNTPLSWAARNGHLNVVRVLIEQYRLPINVQNFDGETALSLAVLSGHYEMTKLLIERGANLNMANMRSESPLHQAAAMGYGVLVRLLVEEGGAYVDAEDECGDTPLHFAVREDKVEIVEYLLAVGADPDHENQDEESATELAEMVGSPAIKNAFKVHNERPDNMVLGGCLQPSLVASFGTKSPLFLQKSSNKKSLKIPNPNPSSDPNPSLSLSNSLYAVWQGENSTSSFPKRLTPNSNLPGGYMTGRQLINV